MKIYSEDIVVYASVGDTSTLYNLDYVLLRTGEELVDFSVSGAPTIKYNKITPIDYAQVYSFGKIQALPRVNGELSHPQKRIKLHPHWVQFNDAFKHNHNGKTYYVASIEVKYKQGGRLVYQYGLAHATNGEVKIRVSEESLTSLFTLMTKV